MIRNEDDIGYRKYRKYMYRLKIQGTCKRTGLNRVIPLLRRDDWNGECARVYTVKNGEDWATTHFDF